MQQDTKLQAAVSLYSVQTPILLFIRFCRKIVNRQTGFAPFAISNLITVGETLILQTLLQLEHSHYISMKVVS